MKQGTKRPSLDAIAVRLREIQAVELRLAGMPYDRIAQTVGYRGSAGAWQAVQRALSRQAAESTEKVRQIELARVERLILAHWEQAIAGDVKHIEMVRNLMRDKAKLLALDEPAKIDVTAWIREGMDPDEAVREAQAILDSQKGK